MTVRILPWLGLASVLFALPFAGAGHAAAPGACYEKMLPLRQMPDDTDSYCHHLKEGVRFYSDAALPQALAAFERASDAAETIADAEARALARDESRGAKALVLAAMGDAAGADVLLDQAPAASRNVLALLHGFALLRQDRRQEAAAALALARRELPEFWSSRHEEVLQGLERGDPRQAAEVERLLAYGHHLPSYLLPAALVGTAMAQVVPVPAGRSFQILFDPGRAAWKDTPDNNRQLDRMATAIATLASRGNGRWTFVVTGHTDQQCPRERRDEAGCRASNLALSEDRAGTIVERLRRNPRVPVERLKAVGAGMERPLVDRGFDRPDPRNRRVDLTVENGDSAPGTADRCPWTLRVYDGDLPVARDGATVPSMVVAPGATPLNVSRDAVYEILFDSRAGRQWPYVSAVSQTAIGGTSDLFIDGGIEGNTQDALRRAGFRIPAAANLYFKVAGDRSVETIELSVSDRPMEWLGGLVSQRAPGRAATTSHSGLSALVPVRRLVTVADPDVQFFPDGRPVLLPDLGAARGGTGRTGRSGTPTFGGGDRPTEANSGTTDRCRFAFSFR